MKTKNKFYSLIPTCTVAVTVWFGVSASCHANSLYGSDTGQYDIDTFTGPGAGSVLAGGGYYGGPFFDLYGIAVGGGGNLFVADGTANTIYKITQGGSISVFANTGLDDPTGLAFDSEGNLYAANWGNNTIEKFTPGGVGSIFASTGLSDPWGLAFNQAGNLFVANGVNNTIEEFTPNGTGSVFASTGLNGPFGLAFNSAGDLFVANEGNNTIEKFTTGGVGSVFASSGLDQPAGLAFDSAGDLYVANNVTDGEIVEYAAGSDSGSIFGTGLDHPTFLATVPVPEPTPLAILAFAAIILSPLLLFRRRHE